MNILNKLTITHLKLNKRRTIVTILAILLSTVLMLGVSLAFSTFKKLQIDMVSVFFGDQHVTFKEVSNEDIKIIRENDKVESVNYSRVTGASQNGDSYTINIKVNNELMKKMQLKKGRFPTKENEVIVKDSNLKINSEHTINNCNYEIDDGMLVINNDANISKCREEKVIVVGHIKEDANLNPVRLGEYTVYYLDDNEENYQEDLYLYVIFDNVKNVQEKIDSINVDKHRNYTINKELLAAHGEVKYGNIDRFYNSTIKMILSVLLVGCAIVIYNSFAISVAERKKQFGMLSSIGTTKTQIIKTVLFEVLLVGILGILLGIFVSYSIALLGVYLINLIADGNMPVTIKVYTDYGFISISIIYIIITILISAIIPAIRASQFSPIELIRQSDDIKIKSKKIKSPKIIEKLFGIEGTLSFKNMKRNKKKYRISVISIVIAIILFITAYTFSTGFNRAMYATVNQFQANSYVSISDQTTKKDREKLINFVNNNSNIKDPMTVSIAYYSITNLKDESLYENTNYKKDGLSSITIFELDTKSFNSIINKIGVKESKPILYNKEIVTSFAGRQRKVYEQKKFIKKPDKLVFYTTETSKDLIIDDFYMSDFEMYNDSLFNSLEGTIVLLVPEGYFKDRFNFNETAIFINVNNNERFKKELEDYSKQENIDYNYFNAEELVSDMNKILLVVNGFLYTFILLVSLIGVTSIINTIATSMNLRKKEFAILRSIGLTSDGFNKILVLESVFIGLKSIAYSIPFCVLIIYGYNNIIKEVYIGNTYIPWKGIIMAISVVILIVLIITIYSTRKMKKENILDTLKRETV